MRLVGYILFILLFCYAVQGGAQARIQPKKHKAWFTLLEAYTQQTIPGRRGAPVQTATHFIIIWHGRNYPESNYPGCFYWRGDTATAQCNVVKVHKLTTKAHNFPEGIDYTTENISLDQIRAGDTLQLTPVMQSKITVPTGIPANSHNTLFFKVAGSQWMTHTGWLTYPVKTLTKKRAISMP